MLKKLIGWHESFMDQLHKKPKKTAPLCIFWSVLKENNKVAFSSTTEFVQTFLGRLCTGSRLLMQITLHFDYFYRFLKFYPLGVGGGGNAFSLFVCFPLFVASP